MKIKKDYKVQARVNETQFKYIESLISSGKAKNQANALQILINKAIILGGK